MSIPARIEKGKIERYEGEETKVILPEEVQGAPLTTIGVKAFLSCRCVECLELPESITCIEDWAFAHMKNLRELVLPAKELSFGKKVFLGCEKLEKISLCKADTIYQGIPYLLASLVRFTQEPPKGLILAGSRQGQGQWLAEYDEALLQFLMREDTYGFEPAFIGWFNIEDVDDQQEDFVRERRRNKIALVLQRLLYGEGMSEETGEKLTDYLSSVRETVAEMLTEKDSVYSTDVRYFQIWQSIGGFQVLSPRELLNRLQEGEPEIRAFLMACELDQSEAGDIFAALNL